MPRAKKDTFALCKLRSCRVRFRKNRKDQLFCCREHKDTYYRHGAFPFEKMKDEIMRAVQAELAPLRERLEAIEERLNLQHVGDGLSLAVVPEFHAKRGGGAAA